MLDRTCRALSFVTLLGVAACTMPIADERTAAGCQATEWEVFGYNDGLLGIPRAYRAQEFADCAALGYPADIRAYELGYSEGIRIYCTVDNGYDVGHAGRRYYDVCPADLEPGFLQGYRWGRQGRPADLFLSLGFYFGPDFHDDSAHRRYRRPHRRDRDDRHDHQRDGRGDHDRGDTGRGDRDRGDRDRGDRDRGDRDRGDRDRGDRDRGDRDRGDWDRGDTDRSDRDSGGSDWDDRDSGDSDSGDRDSGGYDSDDRDSDDTWRSGSED